MSKGMDSKKQTKKAPERTMKEKRAAKRELKRASRAPVRHCTNAKGAPTGVTKIG